MSTQGIVLRIGELFLKGANRPMFESALARRVKELAARHLGEYELHRGQGRLYLRGGVNEPLLEAIRQIYGLASVSPVTWVRPELEAIVEASLKEAERAQSLGAKSFRVTARRADKRFPMTSPQLNAAVGQAVVDQLGLSVDLEEPDLTLGIEIGPHHSFLFTETIAGAGGLPVGVAGEATLLISGGIDSPVAGHLMQKRGLRLSAVHFHSAPWTSAASQEKVRQLAAKLATRQGQLHLLMVPFGGAQDRIREVVEESWRVIVYRRMMVRIAQRFAEGREAKALITGDSLGQVASQTIENLACVEDAASLLVLRPLLGFDKAEVIALARRLGTYEISIQPHDDCCSLFVPRHPQTKGTLKRARRVERDLAIEEMVDEALDSAEAEVIEA